MSPSLPDKNELVKIAARRGDEFSYHDDCGNYAQGVAS